MHHDIASHRVALDTHRSNQEYFKDRHFSINSRLIYDQDWFRKAYEITYDMHIINYQLHVYLYVCMYCNIYFLYKLILLLHN